MVAQPYVPPNIPVQALPANLQAIQAAQAESARRAAEQNTSPSPDTLRGAGSSLNFTLRRISAAQKDLERLEAKKSRDRERFDASDPRYEQYTSKWDAKIAQKRENLAREQAEYNRKLEELSAGGIDAQDALKSAPKNYRTDLQNLPQYTYTRYGVGEKETVVANQPNRVGKIGAGPTGIATKTPTATQTAIQGRDMNDPAVRAALREQINQGLYSNAGDAISGRINPVFTPQYGYSTKQGQIVYTITPTTRNNINQKDTTTQNVQYNDRSGTRGDSSPNSLSTFPLSASPLAATKEGLGQRIIRDAAERTERANQDIDRLFGVKYSSGDFFSDEQKDQRLRGFVAFFPKVTAAGLGGGQTVIGEVLQRGQNTFRGDFAANDERNKLYVQAIPVLITESIKGIKRNIGTGAGQGELVASLITPGRGSRLSKTESLTVQPVSGSVSRFSITDTAVAGTADIAGVASVGGKRVPVRTSAIVTGESIPNTPFYDIRVQTQSAVPTKAGVQYVPEDFRGYLDTRNNVVALVDDAGNPRYISQTGRSETVFFDSVTGTDRAPSRYINLAPAGEAKLPVVVSAGETGSLLDTVQFTKVPYRNIEGFNIFGAGTQKSVVSASTKIIQKATGGANTDLFRGGFQVLERTGLYKDPYFVQGDGLSLFKNRRGSISVSTNVEPILPKPEINIPQSQGGGLPRQIDLTGLEVRGNIVQTRSISPPYVPAIPVLKETAVPTKVFSGVPTVVSAPTYQIKNYVESYPKNVPQVGIDVGRSSEKKIAAVQISSPATSRITDTDARTQTAPKLDSVAPAKIVEQPPKQNTTPRIITPGKVVQPTIPQLEEPDVVPRKKKTIPSDGMLVPEFRVLLRRRGVFRELGSGSKAAALSLGSVAARSSLGATFKVEQTGRFVREKGARAPDLSQFREYRVVRGERVSTPGTFVQKARYRLSSPSERSEIKAAKKRGAAWL